MKVLIGTAVALGLAVAIPSARAAEDPSSSGGDQSQAQPSDQTQVKPNTKVTHKTTKTTTEEVEVQPTDQPATGEQTTTPPPSEQPTTTTPPPTEQPATTTPEQGAQPGTVGNPNPPEQGGFGPSTQTTTPSEQTTPPPDQTTEAPYMTPSEVKADHEHGPGFSIMAGGGVFGYPDKQVRDATSDVGGAYTARLAIGTRMPIGFEVGYIGSAQGINALGLSPNAVLLSNGVEGDVRLNLGAAAVQPYVLGGAAWRHYSISNTSYNSSSLDSSDNVLEIPVGVGVAFRFSGLVIDARGDYRFARDDTLLRTDTSGSRLSNWEATLKAGVEF